MKIRDHDPFFTLDRPVLKIRPDTPAEAERRAERWAASRAVKLLRQLKAIDGKDRRATRKAAGGAPAPEPLTPWREVSATWRRLCVTYGAYFLDEDEEELIRLAFHEGGSRWHIFRRALGQRRRDAEERQAAAERASRRAPLSRLFEP